MKQGLLILTLLFLLVAILALSWPSLLQIDGFAGTPPTVAELIKDRASPLASSTVPQRNPAAAIGITNTAASSLRNLMGAAMGGAVSPRLDTEDSYLGLAKFCKETAAASSGSPFSNPAFSDNCGICMSEGQLVLQDASGKPIRFTSPTGVLVYKADKEAAIATQATENYSFPHVIPSLGAATCLGASTGKDAKPVLAVRQSDYVGFKRRAECQAGHIIGNECGLCINPSVYTYVPRSSPTNPLTLRLWGLGAVTVLIRGNPIAAKGAPAPRQDASGLVIPPPPTMLSESQAQVYSLGSVTEGSSVEINVKGEQIYIYGILLSKNAVNKDYKLTLDRFIDLDYVSSNPPRRGAPKFFTEVQRALIPLKPSGASMSAMKLVGSIPITMVESDQLAAYDCPTSPITTIQASADMLINSPCMKPKGQGPGSYSKECLQDIFTTAGCSVDGDWYKDPVSVVGGMSMADIIKALKQIVPISRTNVYYAKACLGLDISTPCDNFFGGQGIPSKECLIYTYKNQSEGSRIGRSYKGVATNFSSLETRKTQFCQPEGRLNPETPEGESRLRDVAAGYKGIKGLDAVRSFLTDVFTKATGNLDVNIPDVNGGRRDSWADCFGIPIADPPLGAVKLLTNGQVIPAVTSACAPLPTSYTPQYNRLLGQVNMTGDYELSFTIRPNGYIGGWGNIVRFQSRQGRQGDCCTFGMRSPAIWFFPSATNLHVRIGDSTDGNWGINTHPIPIGQASKFRLVCKGRSVVLTLNSYTYSQTQPTRRYSGPMAVHGGDQWYNPANCLITDFCYTVG